LKSTYDWIIFTSTNGVRFTKQRLFQLGLDVRIFGPSKLAAIGNPTADAIREQFGLRVDLCPQRFVAEALAEEIVERGEAKGKRFLLLRADIARPLLKERLQEAGATLVLDIPIYETKPPGAYPPEITAAIEQGQIDWITFTSSSTVKNFLSAITTPLPPKIKLASIGPVTSATLKSAGMNPEVEADPFTIEGLVQAIRDFHATAALDIKGDVDSY
jgi:uroporphyrinogen III methyltransferase/synthase